MFLKRLYQLVSVILVAQIYQSECVYLRATTSSYNIGFESFNYNRTSNKKHDIGFENVHSRTNKISPTHKPVYHDTFPPHRTSKPKVTSPPRSRTSKPKTTSAQGNHRTSKPKVTSPPRNHRTSKPKVTSPPRNHHTSKPKVTSPPRNHHTSKPKVTSPPRNHHTSKPKVTSPPRIHHTSKPKVTSPPRNHHTSKPKVTSPPRNNRTSPPKPTKPANKAIATSKPKPTISPKQPIITTHKPLQPKITTTTTRKPTRPTLPPAVYVKPNISKIIVPPINWKPFPTTPKPSMVQTSSWINSDILQPTLLPMRTSTPNYHNSDFDLFLRHLQDFTQKAEHNHNIKYKQSKGDTFSYYFEVHNYYNKRNLVSSYYRVPVDNLKNCQTNTSKVMCIPNTNAICLTNGTIMCVTHLSAAIPCENNTEYCAVTYVPCDGKYQSCIGNEQIYIAVPCVSKVTLSPSQNDFYQQLTVSPIDYCVTSVINPRRLYSPIGSYFAMLLETGSRISNTATVPATKLLGSSNLDCWE
ncbi:hypothetical protein FQA39_LY10400 [Lamprigera yunnana]|nr:hypothetical protein FQA39_LY10400 [Lamprigera yunnana]